jgi:recombination protein RecT
MADTTKVRNQLATRTAGGDTPAMVEGASTATVVRASIDRQSGAFRQVLPAGVDPDRFSRLVLTAVKAAPDLMRCFATPQGETSVLLAAMQCAAVGLEPNTPTQDAWMVPRQNHGVWECLLWIGYRGQLKLARRSGNILEIVARVVRERDQFEWWFDLDGDHLHHRPGEGDRGALQYAYAIARFTNGGKVSEVLSKAQVEGRRVLSDSWKTDKGRQFSPWTKWPEAMWRKSALRALVPYLDLSPEAAGVLRADETRLALSEDGIIDIAPDDDNQDSGGRSGTDDGGTVVEPGPAPSDTGGEAATGA